MTRTLSVWVGASIIYLYGTVNGEAATFTLIGAGEWQATVPRAEDDNYVLHLEAYSANGLEGTYDYTLYYGMMPCITDRTEADVRNRTPKGFYNAADLNRVEHNARYLADQLSVLPFTLLDYLEALNVAPDEIFAVPYEHPVELATKADWQIRDIPLLEEMIRYLSNVAVLRGLLELPSDTPMPPESMNDLSVTGANNIELILFAVNEAMLALEALTKHYANNTAAAFWYSGELYSGEV